MKHAIDQAYVYPLSTGEIQCTDSDEMILEDHKHALHGYMHLYSYDCDHCYKKCPGDSVMYDTHLLCAKHYVAATLTTPVSSIWQAT